MPPPPNVLFIFTDEQRYDTMGCYGNDWIQTPNLNRLADESFIFENAYVTQPVCTPSRSTIMTGLYPHTTGCLDNNIPLRPQTPTIAEMVGDDYVCAYFGKWHLGDEVIAQHGFTEWVSIEDMYRRYYSSEDHLSCMSDYHHFLVENGFLPNGKSVGAKVFGRQMAAKLAQEFTKASFLAKRTTEFIQANRDRPFVLYVNFLEPHMPFTGPFDDLYDPDELPVGPHFRKKPAENAAMRNRRMANSYLTGDQWQEADLTAEAGWRSIRARYMGLVTLVDNAVGAILTALEQAQLAENTIVVFTSDHGDMMGDHGMFAKCVMYEEAVKIPLLVRVPSLAGRQRRIAGRLSQVDLVPTLLELLGEPIPDELQGRSRAGVLAGKDTLEGNDVFIEWNAPAKPKDFADAGSSRQSNDPSQCWRTVVSSDGWKLNLSAGDKCELYNLRNDTHELRNLFDDPAQQAHIKNLTARIRAWQASTNDTCPLPEI